MSRMIENAERKGWEIFNIEVLVKPGIINPVLRPKWPYHSEDGEHVRIMRELADLVESDDPEIVELWNIKRYSKEESWEII